MNIRRSASQFYLPVFWLTGMAALAGACDVKRGAPSTPEAEDGTNAESPNDQTPVSPARFLYVSSGSCFGGDVTAGAVPSGSNTVARYNLETKEFAGVIVDYNQIGSSDSPVGLVDFSESKLLVLIENGSSRRIDVVDKTTGEVSLFLTNSNLNGVMRDLVKLSDGGFLISKSTAIERFNMNKSRLTSGANPFISAPGGACATSTSWMVGAVRLPSGLFAFIHSNTNPNNEIGIISATGYSGTANCLYAQSAFNTAARPTSLLVEQASGDLLVAYGSATPTANAIYSFQVNAGTGAVSNAVPAFTDYGYISAPSKMHQDLASGSIFVASARGTYSSIERLSYDPIGRTLARGETFAGNSIYTKCITGMATGE